MLPNWLLGKSKSKLQEILGGGGGGGTDYTAGDGIDISNGVISFDPATTPAIDPSKIDGLGDDLSALTPKTAISNPNILHNPWFQVNQRQVTTTSDSDTFIVDRWKTNIASGTTGTFTKNSDGTITIANTSQASGDIISMYQKRTVKTLNRLKGRKVTLSVMLADGTIYSGTGVVPSSGVIHVFNNGDIAIGLDEMEDKLFTLKVYGGKTVTIKALKLEVGEISTLAMDTAPDMATELLKCQRYFQRIFNDQTNPSAIANGLAKNSQAILITLAYPISMLVKSPSLTASQDACTYSEGEYSSGVTAASISGSYSSSHARALNVNGTDLTVGKAYNVYLNPNSYIDFDAEL